MTVVSRAVQGTRQQSAAQEQWPVLPAVLQAQQWEHSTWDILFSASVLVNRCFLAPQTPLICIVNNVQQKTLINKIINKHLKSFFFFFFLFLVESYNILHHLKCQPQAIRHETPSSQATCREWPPLSSMGPPSPWGQDLLSAVCSQLLGFPPPINRKLL